MKRKSLLGNLLVAMAVITLFTYSCEKGNTGAAGNNGPKGDLGPGGTSATWTFITADTTWGPTSGEIVLDRNTMVKPGVTLTILPGTVVAFYPDVFLYVDGALQAEGTASQKITFKIKDEFVDLIEPEAVPAPGEKPARSKVKLADGYGYYFFEMGVAIEKNGVANITNALFKNFLSLLSATDKNLVVDGNQFDGGEFTCIRGTPTITNNTFTNGAIYFEETCCPQLIADNVVEVIESYLTMGQIPCNFAIKRNRVSGDIYLRLYSSSKSEKTAAEPEIGHLLVQDGETPGQIGFDVSDNTVTNDGDNWWTGIYLYSDYNILNGAIRYNEVSGSGEGIYVQVYFGDSVTFSYIDITYNDVHDCSNNGIIAYDYDYGAWISIENNNAYNNNSWGISGSGELRGNYLAGNSGAAPTKIDTTSGGVVDHNYSSCSSSTPQQWCNVDACFYPRSNPNPDAGPR